MTDAAPDTRAPDPTATADAWAAAGVLAGRYELGVLLGEGGMGVVHSARDRGLDREVAVKLLKPGVPADSPAVTRFTVEAKVTGQLQHPGIPAVHELGTLPDGKPFLAMKLVKGQTLQELLQARPDPLHDRGRFIAIFEQVGHAVGYPRHPTYRKFYHDKLITLVQANAGLLDQAAAVPTAQTLRDLDGDQPGNAYDAACAVSLCIPLVAKHDKLDAEKRQAAAQFYGDAAMKLLRDAGPRAGRMPRT